MSSTTHTAPDHASAVRALCTLVSKPREQLARAKADPSLGLVEWRKGMISPLISFNKALVVSVTSQAISLRMGNAVVGVMLPKQGRDDPLHLHSLRVGDLTPHWHAYGNAVANLQWMATCTGLELTGEASLARPLDGCQLLPLLLVGLREPSSPQSQLALNLSVEAACANFDDVVAAQKEQARSVARDSVPRNRQGARAKQNKAVHTRQKLKKNRFAVFAAFLMDKCGGRDLPAQAEAAMAASQAQEITQANHAHAIRCLNSGTGVLDVAGGKGVLAMELAVRYGVCCTVVDPVVHPLTKFKSKELLTHCWQLAKRAELECGAAATGPALNMTPESDALASQSKGNDCGSREDQWRLRRARHGSLTAWLHISIANDVARAAQLSAMRDFEHAVPMFLVRCLFNAEFVGRSDVPSRGSSSGSTNTNSSAKATINIGDVDRLETCTVRPRKTARQASRTPTACAAEPPFDEAETAELFARCSVVTGLHPDQATEPIVRHCLKARKPFLIMPCCVFPNDNPHRRTPAGNPVRSLEDFITFLQALDHSGEMQRATLDAIPGCNTVLHYRLNKVGQQSTT